MKRMEHSKRYFVTAYKNGKEIFTTNGDTDTAAIDRAASKLVEQGFDWKGVPVALGMVLKARPNFQAGELQFALYQQ